MKNLIQFTLLFTLIILLAGCKGCEKKIEDEYVITPETPSNERELKLSDGYLEDCFTTQTGSTDLFTIRVKVRGLSGFDNQGNPNYFTYRPYVWVNVSNVNNFYSNTIEIPESGAFVIDISITSNNCIKCCTQSQNCSASFGIVEFEGSKLYDGNNTVNNPIIISEFTKICF